MDNVIILPDDAQRFSGFIVGHSVGPKGDNHGTHAIAVLAGPEFLFNDAEDNHGIECEIIIIPRRRLHTAKNASGDRVKYGDILTRAEEMYAPEAWVEKGGVQG